MDMQGCDYMNGLQEIINRIKEELVNYTDDVNISNYITDNIKIIFLDSGDFLREAGVDSFSSAPGAFHKTSDNSVNVLKKDNYTEWDYHKLIHEMLHAYSNNYFKSGKSGLQVSGYDENNNLISVGGTINEAATEYITSIINKDGFIAYPNDMKCIFEIFIDILDIRSDFVEIYFQEFDWITDELNKKFNSEVSNQLDEFVLEFDNRLPMYRKNPYNFNKLVAILIDAIRSKLNNAENVNFELLCNDLINLKRVANEYDFEFSQENASAIDSFITNNKMNNEQTFEEMGHVR